MPGKTSLNVLVLAHDGMDASVGYLTINPDDHPFLWKKMKENFPEIDYVDGVDPDETDEILREIDSATVGLPFTVEKELRTIAY